VTKNCPDDYFLELVVARYEEDLRWLRRVPASFRISIYNKGVSPALPESLLERGGVTVTALPNMGREAHSYLTHLINHHDSPAGITVFCQGRPFDHAPDLHDRLHALAEGIETPEPFLWYGFLEESDDPHGRRLFVPWSKNPAREELATGRIFERLFENPSPDLFHFRGGAQFAVSRAGVTWRSKGFYEKARNICTTELLAPHSLERLWDRFFGNPIIDPVTLGSEGTRYLKKIRRLEEVREISKEVDSG
jgi:hypothetical protein